MIVASIHPNYAKTPNHLHIPGQSPFCNHNDRVPGQSPFCIHKDGVATMHFDSSCGTDDLKFPAQSLLSVFQKCCGDVVLAILAEEVAEEVQWLLSDTVAGEVAEEVQGTFLEPVVATAVGKYSA